MINYVLGFAFDKARERVVLIRKERGPQVNIGLLNGVGGKIEGKEEDYAAMSREFFEETGVWLPDFLWDRRGHFSGKDWRVTVFSVFSDEVVGCRTTESEKVLLSRVDEAFGRYACARNVEKLLQLCLDERIEYFSWTEV
jgi:8-oxo-dGTP pyrophosphatase MutT (NUDIX family)